MGLPGRYAMNVQMTCGFPQALSASKLRLFRTLLIRSIRERWIIIGS